MPPITDCPVCQDALERVPTLVGDGYYYPIDCRRCGTYRVPHTVYRALAAEPLEPIQIGTASGYLRSAPDLLVTSDVVRTLRQLQALPVGDQADRLLLHLSRKHPQPSAVFRVSLEDPALQATVWANGAPHLRYLLIRYLKAEHGYILIGGGNIQITPKGWSHVYALRHTSLASAQGFIAMYFSSVLYPLRDRALIPAIADAGYTPFIVNKHPHNQDIMAEIIVGIRRSRSLIADFTGNRQSVYYEAGVALGLGIPIIHTCQTGRIRRVAFDVNHNNILEWRPETLDEFRTSLADHIEATIGRGPNAP